MNSFFSVHQSIFFQSNNDFKSQVKKIINLCADMYYKHSDALSSLSILALNTSILASRIFQSLPRIIERSANTLLNFVGVVWLNMQLRNFAKKGMDCLFAAQARDWKGLIFCAAKVTVTSLSILLTCGTFIASIVALSGVPELALAMYLLMRPFSLFSLILGIIVDITDYKINDRLNGKITIILNSHSRDNKIRTIMSNFLTLLSEKNESSIDKLALHIFRQQEHYTLEKMRELVGQEQSQEDLKKLFLSLKQTLENKQLFTKANFGLIALGYLSMGICRLYPETLIQSLVLWSMSLLYTGKLLYQKHLS
jgi:hypothetical protein